MACKSGFAKGKNDSYAGQKGPFFWFVFFGPAKKMNNVVSAAILQANSKKSFKKQYLISINVYFSAKPRKCRPAYVVIGFSSRQNF
ncbi:MAG: hypothetical protein CFE24_09555 [Flavobacterium sp. BFFFF2]|nr:MAG: hypothetical protein CFE24_09555 [Flavobacterium sp. BFFFF2]